MLSTGSVPGFVMFCAGIVPATSRFMEGSKKGVILHSILIEVYIGVPYENYHFQGLYHEIFELSQIQGAICRLHESGRLPVADASTSFQGWKPYTLSSIQGFCPEASIWRSKIR